MRNFVCALCAVVLVCVTQASAQESAWVNVSDPLVAQLEAEGKKPAWPGKSAGVAVDRTTGHVFLVIAGQGLFKSSDGAKTFERCDEGKVGGRCETGYSINSDPNSAKMACFQLDGKCGMTLDGGKSWSAMKDNGRNWDYADVDWGSEKPSVIFGLLHEAGGQLMLSTDAGASWAKLEKDPKVMALGVADANTFLLSKGEGLLRSTDQGKTWTKVSDLTPTTRVMKTMGGIHYFFARVEPAARNAKTFDAFIVTSKDKGATWEKQGTMVDAAWGPYFGKDANHLITLGRRGLISESTDGGKTWKDVTPLPGAKEGTKDYSSNQPGWFVNLGYDPASDTFYVSRMGQPAFKYARGK